MYVHLRHWRFPLLSRTKSLFLPTILCFSALFSGCGGGGSPTVKVVSYTIGGTLSGLTGKGLVLQNTGGNNLTVSANGPFTFSSPISSGSAYSVTVLTQPSSPAQICAVSNATGMAGANVTNVQVVCTNVAYTIGGTVSGLAGTGLVLENNGGDNLSVTASGAFTFPTAVAPGSAYMATVATQPTNPAQLCTVASGTGTASANVTIIAVTCATITQQWAWEGGPTGSNLFGVYGALGVAAPTNYPGSRVLSAQWADASGNLWLFGGLGYAATQKPGAPDFTDVLNDLWELKDGQWIWMGGSDLVEQPGVYGTLGVPSAANIPTPRQASASWTDKAGNFWLFGGEGNDANGDPAILNDLWKYSNGQWTWMSGSKAGYQAGTYGTKGTPATENAPGARSDASTWTDAAGTLWLFGGNGLASTQDVGFLNDLWRYSNGEWTWISGSDTIGGPGSGSYGTLGVASANNVPPARLDASSWTDSEGNLWLFGGDTLDLTQQPVPRAPMNDLWKFSKGQWTWVNGSNLQDQLGNYGTQGVADPGNAPQARRGSAAWADQAGNLWLYGGLGSEARLNPIFGDLWKFDGSEWTWVEGLNLPDSNSVFGMQGVPAADNNPGSAGDPIFWTDASGNFWLLRGIGHINTDPNYAIFNTLWEFQP